MRNLLSIMFVVIIVLTIFITPVASATDTDVDGIRNQFKDELFQNHPNPFERFTVIKYSVSCKSEVILEIFDIDANVIAKLVDTVQDAGDHEVTWRPEKKYWSGT